MIGKSGLDERTTMVAKDEEALDYIEGRIAELEQKLRQIDN